MKTRRLSTMLTSAYLSAMLASSVAPIRSNATLAGTIDPSAARQAFQSAVNGLDAAGWTAEVTEISATEPMAEPLTYTPKAKTETGMTPEYMARLIKYTRSLQGTGTMSSKLCKVLNLCDGSADMILKLAKSDSTDGDHYFGLPTDESSEDVIFAVKRGTVVEVYLTRKNYRLRAAAILENDTATLITNEKAASKFKAELTLFAGEAATLPPTGETHVASTEAGS